MADFNTVYDKYIKPAEGGYVNIKSDKGGETYGGIARNMHPHWSGWNVIDRIKKERNGTIKRYTKFPELDVPVRQFFLNWWNENNFGAINSQNVANLLFDFFVNSGKSAIKGIQKIVGVDVHGVMNPKTIAAINDKNSESLFSSLLSYRKEFYRNIVKREPDQAVHLNGWMNRLAKFGTAKVILPLGAFLFLTLTYFFVSK